MASASSNDVQYFSVQLIAQRIGGETIYSASCARHQATFPEIRRPRENEGRRGHGLWRGLQPFLHDFIVANTLDIVKQQPSQTTRHIAIYSSQGWLHQPMVLHSQRMNNAAARSCLAGPDRCSITGALAPPTIWRAWQYVGCHS
jgi:hypothetical protein